jgi:DNA-binding response OmpR family regulator
MKPLIAVPDETQATSVARLLRANGFVVDTVITAEEMVTALKLAKYDILLLDLALPHAPHCDLLEFVRKADPEIRLLALSADNGPRLRVNALNKGADDLIVKPYVPEELLARVRALLRRPAQLVVLNYNAGNVSLNSESRGVHISANPVRLPRQAFTILEVLMRNRDRVLPREKLEHAAFPFDRMVTPNALEAAVSRLRRHLAQHGSSITVISYRNDGYRLAPHTDGTWPVQAEQSTAAD